MDEVHSMPVKFPFVYGIVLSYKGRILKDVVLTSLSSNLLITQVGGRVSDSGEGNRGSQWLVGYEFAE